MPNSSNLCLFKFVRLLTSLLIVFQFVDVSAAESICHDLFTAKTATAKVNSDSGAAADLEPIFFPKSLKLQTGLSFLLKDPKHAPLIRAIGSLFHTINQHPDLYQEIASALSAPPVEKFDINLYRSVFGEAQTRLVPQATPLDINNSAQAFEVFARLSAIKAELGLSSDQLFLISHSFRQHVNMDSSAIDELAQYNVDVKSQMQTPNDEWRGSPAYEKKVTDRAKILAQGSQSVKNFFRSLVLAYAHNPDPFVNPAVSGRWEIIANVQRRGHGRFQFEAISLNPSFFSQSGSVQKFLELERQVPTLFEVTGPYIASNIILNLIYFHEGQSGFKVNSYLKLEERSATDLHEKSRELVSLQRENGLNAIENAMAQADGISTPDTLINMIDHMFYGARIMKGSDVLEADLLSSLNSLLLPAKNDLSQMRSQWSEAEVENQSRSYSPPAAPSFEFKPYVAERRTKARPAEKKNSAETSETNQIDINSQIFSAEQASAKPSVKLAPNDISFFVADASQALLPGVEYEFAFARNPANGRQKIKFSEQAADDLNQKPDEKSKLLRALTLGYTARNSQGIPGVKRLWIRGSENQILFEVKPGKSNFRLILEHKNGQWLATKLVTKDQM
jgi:hypothetical protein